MPKWDRVERRHDYPEISERLTKLEVLQTRDLDEAIEWRKLFCAKVDKILGKMESLPCDLRQGWYKSMGSRVQMTMWAIGIILVIMGLNLWWGGIDRNKIMDKMQEIQKETSQIETNTHRLERLEERVK